MIQKRAKELSNNNLIGNIYLLMVFTNDILDNLRLNYGNLSTNMMQPGFVLIGDGKIEWRHLPQKRISNS